MVKLHSLKSDRAAETDGDLTGAAAARYRVAVAALTQGRVRLSPLTEDDDRLLYRRPLTDWLFDHSSQTGVR